MGRSSGLRPQVRGRIPWVLVILAAGFAAALWFVPQSRRAPPEAPRVESPVVGAKLPPGWNPCSNEVYGYIVGFPEGWYTQRLSPDQACRWFDPQRFQLVPASEAPFTALAGYPSPETYDEAVGGSVNPGLFRVLLREALTILARRGVRLEIQATGTGPLPEGILLYRYIVDMGDRGTFEVETTNLATSDYASNKAIVD